MNSMQAQSAEPKEIIAISPQKQTILDFIDQNGFITEPQIMELVKVKKTRAYNIAKEMHADKLIKPIGRGSAKKYVRM